MSSSPPARSPREWTAWVAFVAVCPWFFGVYTLSHDARFQSIVLDVVAPEAHRPNAALQIAMFILNVTIGNVLYAVIARALDRFVDRT